MSKQRLQKLRPTEPLFEQKSKPSFSLFQPRFRPVYTALLTPCRFMSWSVSRSTTPARL